DGIRDKLVTGVQTCALPIFQDRAGDRDPLLLAARKFQAALADLGVVALRRHADEAVDLRQARGLLDLLVARFPAAVADVVADRRSEERRVGKERICRRLPYL